MGRQHYRQIEEEKLMADPIGASSIDMPPPATVPAPNPTPAVADDDDFGVGMFVDRLVRMAAQGTTLGFADEIAAFARSKTEDITYEQALKEEQAKDDIFRDRNPKSAIAANITGAVANPLSKLGVAAKGAGFMAKVVRGAVTGAGMGAVTGAGEARGDLRQRAKGAAIGTVTGGVFGGISPAFFHALGKGGRGLVRLMTGRGDKHPEAQAARYILDAFRKDQIDGAEALRRLRALGGIGTLADVGEENVRGAARAVQSMSGPAKTTAKKIMETRQLAQSDRIVNQARKAFGELRKYATTMDDLQDLRKVMSGPLYKKALARDIPFTKDLQAILQTDAGRSAWKAAQKIASNEGKTLPNIIDDNLNISAAPDMQTWNYIKRGLDSVLNGHRNQMTRKLDLSDPIVGSINEVRKKLLTALDAVNLDYKAARAAYAGPAQAEEMMLLGRQFVKGDADVLAKTVAEMSPSDRDFFRLGVVEGIRDKVDNTLDMTNAYNAVFGRPKMRRILQAVFPPKAYAQFEKFMQAEQTMGVTRKAVLENSITQRMVPEQGALARAANTGADVMSGNYVNVVREAINSLKTQGFPQEMVDAAGRMLFTTGDKINTANLEKIFTATPLAGVPVEVSQTILQNISGRLSAGLAVGSVPASQEVDAIRNMTR